MCLADDRYLEPIRAAVIAAAGTGVPVIFVPALDMGGIGVIWTAMIGGIASGAGQQVARPAIARLAAAAVGAASGYVLDSKILTWLAAPLMIAFPVAGVPQAVAVSSMLNGIFTLRLGAACAHRFADPAFTAAGMPGLTAGIGNRLARLPSGDEIKMIKDILAAS
jgi:hypothetical protein